MAVVSWQTLSKLKWICLIIITPHTTYSLNRQKSKACILTIASVKCFNTLDIMPIKCIKKTRKFQLFHLLLSLNMCLMICKVIYWNDQLLQAMRNFFQWCRKNYCLVNFCAIQIDKNNPEHDLHFYHLISIADIWEWIRNILSCAAVSPTIFLWTDIWTVKEKVLNDLLAYNACNKIPSATVESHRQNKLFYHNRREKIIK